MDPISVMAIGGLIMSAAGTAYSVYSQNKAANAADDAAKKNAAMEMDAANKDAANIRDKAARLKGMQSAALAAGGVSLGSGSADAILGETDRLSEQDALEVIREGGQRADLIRRRGQLTADTYRSQGIATALEGASTILGGATSYKKATADARRGDAISSKLDSLVTKKGAQPSILGGNSQL